MKRLITDLLAVLTIAPYPLPGVAAKNAYAVAKPGAPQVLLAEYPSNEGVYLDGNPAIVQNSYQLEVYSKDASIAGVVTPKSEAVMQLFEAADAALTGYGLTMVGTPTAGPYTEDATMMRVVARYIAWVDTRTDHFQIYRNL